MSSFLYTPGEPAGIGPDLIIQLAQQTLPHEIVVVADPQLLQARAQQLQLPLQINLFDPTHKQRVAQAGQLTVLPVRLTQAVQSGQLNVANAAYVIETLTLAAKACLQGQFAAVVTGPVHKGILNDAGIQFSGHTEFFAELAAVDHVVMLFVAKQLRMALATTHLPLHAVAAAITSASLTKTLEVLQRGLQQYFALPQPRILVAGLNPHAGEGGHLGTEEIEVIIPVLDKLRAVGMQLLGPLPADTLFTPKYLAQADVILAMYHDQGLPVLKHIGFEHAVNVTLGLSFIRTSVDHGTALELASSGKADVRSLQAAIQLAAQMAKNASK